MQAEYDEAQRIRAAMEQAEARGEYVSAAQVARTGGACVGRTRSEFIAYISAVQDVEDARERARTRHAVQYDAEQHQAALIAINPTVGRTREEARAYYSALADIQELEAARCAQHGLRSVEEEQVAADDSQRHDAAYGRRALERRQFLAGEITAKQLVASRRSDTAA